MDRFLIITNKQKDTDLKYTNRIRNFLEEHGKTCLVESGSGIMDAALSPQIQCVVVLGGDGTMLRAARAASSAEIPIIGINLGTLGYLAEVDCENPEKALERLMADDFVREKRMMLSGTLLPVRGVGGIEGVGGIDGIEGIEGIEHSEMDFALNDIAITRSGPLQIITFHIYVNGQLLQTCHADGILVSTPTGSTGYNLSAGGPIVEPRAELILLTPICPHTLHSRTIVLSAEDTVVIEIGESKKGILQKVEAYFDGIANMGMRTGDKMEIKKSAKTTEMLKLSQDSFLEVLHKKMDAE